MTRITLIAAILFSVSTVNAQTPFSDGSMYGMQPTFRQFNKLGDTNSLQKKWFVTKYAGISAGFVAFNGGSNTFLSAPLGFQINRQLNNNVYAFAGISGVAAYSPYLSPLYQPMDSKNKNFMNANNFGIYSAAHVGLMYINNEKTFSISGSFGVGRNLYNNYSPFYAPVNTDRLRNFKQ